MIPSPDPWLGARPQTPVRRADAHLTLVKLVGHHEGGDKTLSMEALMAPTVNQLLSEHSSPRKLRRAFARVDEVIEQMWDSAGFSAAA